MRFMTTPTARPLPPAAQDYLTQVTGHLRDLDRTLQARLVAIAAENLAERPGSATLRGLAADLGGPREYAQMLRDEAESAGPGAIEFSRWRRRRRRWRTVAIALVLVAALIGTAIWWVTWQAAIGSNELRVCDDAATLDQENCGRAGVTDITPANMLEVDCRGVISVSPNLTADREITVTAASLTGIEPRTGPDELYEPGAAPPLVLDDVQVWQNTDPEWDPQRVDWPVTIGPYPVDTFVTFLVTTCPSTADPNPGVSRFIGTMEISYHALGRDRTTTIPLTRPIAVTTR